MPPGLVTRANSAAPLFASGTKKSTSAITATSKRASSYGSAIASPTESSTCFADSLWCAAAICASEGSIAQTDEGADLARISSVNAPFPQPTSTQARPCPCASKSYTATSDTRMPSTAYGAIISPSPCQASKLTVGISIKRSAAKLTTPRFKKNNAAAPLCRNQLRRFVLLQSKLG